MENKFNILEETRKDNKMLCDTIVKWNEHCNMLTIQKRRLEEELEYIRSIRINDVNKEREKCARIAETMGHPSYAGYARTDWSVGCYDMKTLIAKEIREQRSEEKLDDHTSERGEHEKEV